MEIINRLIPTHDPMILLFSKIAFGLYFIPTGFYLIAAFVSLCRKVPRVFSIWMLGFNIIFAGLFSLLITAGEISSLKSLLHTAWLLSFFIIIFPAILSLWKAVSMTKEEALSIKNFQSMSDDERIDNLDKGLIHKTIRPILCVFGFITTDLVFDKLWVSLISALAIFFFAGLRWGRKST
jgi:hypothetical protein